MARELDQDELIERWTLLGDDLDRVVRKRGSAKLGCTLLEANQPSRSSAAAGLGVSMSS